MDTINKKGRPVVTGATPKTSAACNFNPLARIWFTAKHVATALPVECAALIFLLLMAAFTAAGVTL